MITNVTVEYWYKCQYCLKMLRYKSLDFTLTDKDGYGIFKNDDDIIKVHITSDSKSRLASEAYLPKTIEHFCKEDNLAGKLIVSTAYYYVTNISITKEEEIEDKENAN